MKYPKAWELTRKLVLDGIPFSERMRSVSWDAVIEAGRKDVEAMNYQWKGYVTDSLAQLYNIAGTIQAKGNIGYDVTEAESLLEEGKRLYERRDEVNLYKQTLRIYKALHEAKPNPNSEYWKYTRYESFEQYAAAVKFPEYNYDPRKVDQEDLYDRIYAGWLAQTCAGAMGTALEGYHTINIEKAFGTVDRYIKEPEQYNDDITFQLVFLEVFAQKGYGITSGDIAEEWVARIPMGFTAEGVALRNIKQGIYPPESGRFGNHMCEWIGAQMRGAVCGAVAPGNPALAAELAFKDGVISHYNTGVLGEVFNAIMVSLAFVEDDMKKILRMAIDMMPEDSMYRSVLEFAWDACEKHGNWRDAWLECDDKYKEYNWIDAIPNAAAEVVSMYFCENDYEKLCTICCMCGLDVDCNVAQVACVLATAQGSSCIDERWSEPFGDHMITYVRGMETVRFKDLARKTHKSILSAWNKLKK